MFGFPMTETDREKKNPHSSCVGERWVEQPPLSLNALRKLAAQDKNIF